MINGSKIFVTGGSGFIGKHIIRELISQGASVYAPYSISCNLTRRKETLAFITDYNPDYVIHCAGYNGGIAFNKERPAEVFERNTRIALNILDACQQEEVKKVISLITSCAYPDLGEELQEKTFWEGPPNPTIACHGLAKRNIVAYSQFLNVEHGLNAITVCPNTVYGPGDTTDLEKAKVLTALILKFKKAKDGNLNNVTLWGTGEPKREFIYVKDTAKLVIKALENYNNSELPLNISSGQEYKIKNLAKIVAEIVGYKGEIIFDTSKPDGQMRKFLNTDRMKDILGYFEFTSIEQGIKETIESLNG